MNRDIKVVGLSGKFGTGKDYIAHKFFYPRGYKPISLAWHFKVWLVGQGKATHEEVFVTKPPNVRHLLQQAGTEEGRDVYGEDIWVDTMFEWINLFSEKWEINKFVVPDVRFPNEVEGIQRHGGIVLRVNAPQRNANAPYGSEARSHRSEISLDGYTGFDFVIDNDYEDVGTVSTQMKKVFKSMRRGKRGLSRLYQQSIQ